MAFDSEELNNRRQMRAQKAQQRRQADQKLRVRLILAAVIIVVCGVLIFAVTRGGGAAQNDPAIVTEAVQTTAPAEAETEEAPRPAQTVITLAAAGDLNINDAVVASGGIERDFTGVFTDVLPLLTDADLTFLNFEGNLAGQPYGTESVSAPQELLDALVSSGVDMLQVANSRTISNGMIGLNSTLQAIRYAGLEPIGAYASVDEAKKAGGYTIKEIDGVKIAFVAFTKGMDSMALPAGNERCVNLLYKDYASTYRSVDYDGIRDVLRAASQEHPDFTVALLHWGSEYNDVISDTQEEITDLMFENGVDAIIGTHPHYVQSIQFDEEAGTFLCYSLGDFLGDPSRSGTEYSIVLELEITKDNDTDATRITDYRYTPIYTVAEKDKLKVVRLSEAISAYEENNIDAVTGKTYDGMLYATDRVEERIHASDETEPEE